MELIPKGADPKGALPFALLPKGEDPKGALPFMLLPKGEDPKGALAIDLLPNGADPKGLSEGFVRAPTTSRKQNSHDDTCCENFATRCTNLNPKCCSITHKRK